MSRPGNMWRRIHGRITKKPTNFSWVLPGRVAGCGRPTSAVEFQWLHAQGVRCIVSMTEEPLPYDWTEEVSYMHAPTPDMTAPKPEDIEAAVSFMHDATSSGRPAMVHCAAGLGRAGTILACYLVKYENHTASEAIKEIRRLRPGSIQSTDQEMAIFMFHKKISGDN